MSTLNIKRPSNPIKTHEGAQARRTSVEEQLCRSITSCFLWEKEFYEDGCLIADRIRELVPKASGQFVMNLAIQARHEMNLRHIPIFLIREMARHPSHRPFVADALEKVISRADELPEFLAIYWQDKKQPLAASVKKGLARAFVKFNEYALAKYNRDNAIKLRDVLFLCHAKPKNEEQANLWKKLINDVLEIPDTWETRLSAGKDKKESWTALLAEKKLGALAVLRNLRNMQECGLDMKLVKSYLENVDVSKVLPFRFIAAARFAPQLEPDLEKCLFRNISTMDKLKGKTIVLVDVSGSMDDKLSAKSDMTRLDAACGLAMVAREICEDVLVLSFSNQLIQIPPRKGFSLRDAIITSQSHSGTELGGAVTHINSGKFGSFDRLIVITDEQSRSNVPNPKVKGYMLNVASAKNGVGYGPWTHIDGFSEAVIRYILEDEKSQNNINSNR